jgi:hypothetical protein
MKAFVRLLVSLVAIDWATTSGASYLSMEPVINLLPGLDHPPTPFHYMIRRALMPPLASIPGWQTNLEKSIRFRLAIRLIPICLFSASGTTRPTISPA